MTQYAEHGHLGGYIVGGDPATYYPDLWAWLVKEHGVRSVLDVGCGEGHALRYFRELGVLAWGVDGVPQADAYTCEHDFTHGQYMTARRYDLLWCCEVVEHIEERYAHHLLETFKAADMVLMTHAAPGQPGYHHVNCKTADYWVGALAAVGFYLDELLTQNARAQASRNLDPHNHFLRSGLAFRRYK